MKLHELAALDRTQQYAKVYESYFGNRLPLHRLTNGQARRMLVKVRGLLEAYRRDVSRHFSEQDPDYLRMIMLEQGLEAQATAAGSAAGATGTEQDKQKMAMAAQTIATTKDPKLKAALTAASKGQNLTPDQQKLVAGAALMKTESRARRRRIAESEVQQAQVVLAAQDMVDSMQGMLEDTTEMQFKELPALVDSIRNQIGMEQANQFNTDATAALTGLVQNLQGAKQQLEQALAVVTGQAQPTPALDAAMSGGAAGAAPAAAPGGEEELDLSLGANLPAEEPATPAGTAGALGRARR
jgi:hypothetical protein